MSDLKHRTLPELKSFVKKYKEHFKLNVSKVKKDELLKRIDNGMLKAINPALQKGLREEYERLRQPIDKKADAKKKDLKKKLILEGKAPPMIKPLYKTKNKIKVEKPKKKVIKVEKTKGKVKQAVEKIEKKKEPKKKTKLEIAKEKQEKARKINEKLKKERDEEQNKESKIRSILNQYTQEQIEPFFNQLLKKGLKKGSLELEREIKKTVDKMISDKGGDPSIRIIDKDRFEDGFKKRYNKEAKN